MRPLGAEGRTRQDAKHGVRMIAICEDDFMPLGNNLLTGRSGHRDFLCHNHAQKKMFGCILIHGCSMKPVLFDHFSILGC